MKVVNVERMRAAIADVRVGTPFGQEAQVGLLVEDLEGMVDEIELSRLAVKESGDTLEYTRAVLSDCLSMISKPANRARIKGAIAKIDGLLETPPEEVVDPETAAAKAARSRLVGPDGRRLE